MASAVNNARFLELGYLRRFRRFLPPKNGEIIQESSSRIFLSHSEEDYLRREAMYENSIISFFLHTPRKASTTTVPPVVYQDTPPELNGCGVPWRMRPRYRLLARLLCSRLRPPRRWSSLSRTREKAPLQLSSVAQSGLCYALL